MSEHAPTSSRSVVMPAPRRVPPLLAVYPMALAAMAPWPIIMTLALFALDAIDKWWELAFLFGGFTMLGLIPVALFADLPEAAYAAVIALVWLIALFAAPPLVRTRWKTRRAMFVTIICLGVFSLAQALLGAMMIIGKSV